MFGSPLFLHLWGMYVSKEYETNFWYFRNNGISSDEEGSSTDDDNSFSEDEKH